VPDDGERNGWSTGLSAAPCGSVTAPAARFSAVCSRSRRSFHQDDVFVPLGEKTVVPRLAQAGFVDIDVEVGEYEIRFSARKRTGGTA
jgi:hypothetical protein